MSKAERRARKRRNRLEGRLHCVACKHPVAEHADGSHDSPLSWSHVTWDGLSIVAWCEMCGEEIAE